MLVHPSNPRLYLVNSQEVEAGEIPAETPLRVVQSWQQILGWIHAFMADSNPDLGRDGPVCPFTPGSMARGCFWFGFYDKQDPSRREVKRALHRFRKWFQWIDAHNERRNELECFTIAMPGIGPETPYRVLDWAHNSLITEFMQQGLMIGQFHPECENTALHSDRLQPQKSAVPFVVMRHMVVYDHAFLKRAPEIAGMYLERYGHLLDEEMITELQPKDLTPPSRSRVGDRLRRLIRH